MKLGLRAPLLPEPAVPIPPPARRILVVDDLPDVLDVLRGMARRIRGGRVRVDVEVSSLRAMRLAARERYDLVVCDQRLGGADGLSILSAFRQADPLTRRVLMTGYQDVPAAMERVEEALVDAYLPKPFPVTETIRLFEALLDADAPTLAFTRAHARALEADARERGEWLSLTSMRPPAFG